MSALTIISRKADKYIARLPKGMRKAVEDLAGQNSRSMNTEIISAIESHLENKARQALLLNALQTQLPAAKVVARKRPQQQVEVNYLDVGTPCLASGRRTSMS